jgi:hypothetical protein
MFSRCQVGFLALDPARIMRYSDTRMALTPGHTVLAPAFILGLVSVPWHPLESAITRYSELVKVHKREPGPPPDPAAVVDQLEVIRTEISPLTLPDELDWFWRTWDPYGFSELPFPRLTTPEFALESYREAVQDPPYPVVLFPIAYQSHCFLLVELVHPGWIEPRIYWYCFDEGTFQLLHRSLAALFNGFLDALDAADLSEAIWEDDEALASALEEARDDAYRLVRQRIEEATTYEDRRIPAYKSLQWPKSWLDAQGLDPGLAVPQGPTHTVVEFERLRQTAEVEARIVGTVHVLAGGGITPEGAASIARIEDETGAMLVLIRPDATPFGYAERGQLCELEVIGRPDPTSGSDEMEEASTASAATSSKAEDGDRLGAIAEGGRAALEIHQNVTSAASHASLVRLLRPLD